jgi:N-acetylmuramoyl-L-alanine amidase
MKKCALVVGHKPHSPGACNESSGICEFELNNELVDLIISRLSSSVDPDGGIELVKVLRNTYKGLPDDINKLEPDFVVSFHCNAYNKRASGTETLFYHKSMKGKKIAELFQENMLYILELPNRGVKGISVEDRGGNLLRYTNAPCVLIEPFFIDNDNDLRRYTANKLMFVQAIHKSLFEAADVV